ncbi:MAG TPA: hypothetical protein VLC74_13290 [Rhizomicrobium sp.]|nr:hypothetical protein [Rhizomicrobium sp.]
MANPDRKSEAKPKKSSRLNRKIDEQVEESFPASVPPAFMGGKHTIGAPQKRETPAPECTKPKK